MFPILVRVLGIVKLSVQQWTQKHLYTDLFLSSYFPLILCPEKFKLSLIQLQSLFPPYSKSRSAQASPAT